MIVRSLPIFRAASVFALLVTVAALTACGKPAPEPQDVPSQIETPVAGTATIGGQPVMLQVCKTAAERQNAPGKTAFTTIDGVHNGLLHCWPAENPRVVFRQNRCELDTVMVFLQGNGTVVDIAPVPSTPMNLDPAMMGLTDPDIAYAIGDRMTGAFTLNPLVDVRYGVQVAASLLDTVKVNVGDKVQLAPDLLEKSKGAQASMPVLEFWYSPAEDRAPGLKRVKRFALRVATTPEDRARWLTKDSIEKLTEHDVVYVAWPEERIISLQTKDLKVPVFIVPFRTDDTRGNVSGDLIELRPENSNHLLAALPEADREPAGRRGWEAEVSLRNWEYRSKEKYHGFLLMAGKAIYQLQLPETNSVMGGFEVGFDSSAANGGAPPSVPDDVRRRPVLPDPHGRRITLTANGEKPVDALVEVIDTDLGRERGLATHAPLPEAGAGGDGSDGGEGAEPPVFDPSVGNRGPRGEAFLLAFRDLQQRPLFGAGLPGKYDLLVFNERGHLCDPFKPFDPNSDGIGAVVQINSPADLRRPELTKVRYKYALLAPRGWLAHKSLTRPTDPTVPLPLIKLDVSEYISRFQPEPQRYAITVGGHTARVEVVFQKPTRNRGLMWRRDLPADCGMLFLYPAPAEETKKRTFYMVNCFIDIAVAHLRQDWTVSDPIIEMRRPLLPGEQQPEDGDPRDITWAQLDATAKKSYVAGEVTHHALEMPAGWFTRHGVKPGANVEPGDIVRQFLGMTTEQ